MRLIILAVIFSGFCASTLAAERPNVLLIMADDLRDFGGTLTKEVVKTPRCCRPLLLTCRNPTERMNLIHDPEYATDLAVLSWKLLAHMQKTSDPQTTAFEAAIAR